MTSSPLKTSSSGYGGKGTRRKRQIDMFVIHHAAETNLKTVLNMIAGRAYEVSANYVVKDQHIVSCVPEQLRAWTSGSARDNGKGAAIDHRAITVETCNSAKGEPWPISEASYTSLAALVADAHRRYGIPLDRNHIVGHRELWQRWRASYATRCPGGIDLDRVVAQARAIVQSPKQSTSEETELMSAADTIVAAVKSLIAEQTETINERLETTESRLRSEVRGYAFWDAGHDGKGTFDQSPAVVHITTGGMIHVLNSPATHGTGQLASLRNGSATMDYRWLDAQRWGAPLMTERFWNRVADALTARTFKKHTPESAREWVAARQTPPVE